MEDQPHNPLNESAVSCDHQSLLFPSVLPTRPAQAALSCPRRLKTRRYTDQSKLYYTRVNHGACRSFTTLKAQRLWTHRPSPARALLLGAGIEPCRLFVERGAFVDRAISLSNSFDPEAQWYVPLPEDSSRESGLYLRGSAHVMVSSFTHVKKVGNLFEERREGREGRREEGGEGTLS